jgi:hypothetical protein
MRSKNLLFYCATFIFGTLMLLVTSSNGVSNTFDVYAMDNCDPTSNCSTLEIGTDNSQSNNCTNFSICVNAVFGDGNTQTNRCDSVGEFGCFNGAGGNDNTQNIDCDSVGEFGCTNGAGGNDNTQTNRCDSVGAGGCANIAFGNDNTQNLLCARMLTGCNNEIGSFEAPISSNSQSTTCANAGSCSNVGENTNVIANGADCSSHDPGTTTICQPGRTKILPNP